MFNQLLFAFVNAVLLLLALLLLIPFATLFVECFIALLPGKDRVTETAQHPPKITVLVPAHNEAPVIQTTLETLLPQIAEQDRLIVIADNCTDETAEIARACGVTVIERQNATQRGKGYALDYGLTFIAADPPDVVVTVDADCVVEAGAVTKIAQQAWDTGRPVQSAYLMSPPENPSLKDSISALAVVVKNLVRPLGLTRLSLPCLLTGSGMAFPWTVIRQVSLDTSKTVDDMQLGLDLAIAGYPPTYCPSARVTGRLMENKFARSQRSRWEHGHLEALLTEAPRLLKAAIAQRRPELVALALELCVPPLSLLGMVWLVVTGVAIIASLAGYFGLPQLLLASEGLLLLVSIMGVCLRFEQNSISILQLLAVPFYIFWKIPLYVAFLVKPQTRWTHTERDAIAAPKLDSVIKC